MSGSASPVIIIPAVDVDGEARRAQLAKYLATSLLRSLFTGRILILRTTPAPLFRVARVGVEEQVVANDEPCDSETKRGTLEAAAVLELMRSELKISDQWVMIADPATLALRNIDHLFPGSPATSTIETGADVMMPSVSGSICSGQGGQSFAPGIFAAKADRIQSFLLNQQELSSSPERKPDCCWSEIFPKLEGRKVPFEMGEVVAPLSESLDWSAISRAALVSLHGWPEQDQMSLIQSLFFGRCLGDEVAVLLHLMES